jgi:hypothetical protein
MCRSLPVAWPSMQGPVGCSYDRGGAPRRREGREALAVLYRAGGEGGRSLVGRTGQHLACPERPRFGPPRLGPRCGTGRTKARAPVSSVRALGELGGQFDVIGSWLATVHCVDDVAPPVGVGGAGAQPYLRCTGLAIWPGHMMIDGASRWSRGARPLILLRPSYAWVRDGTCNGATAAQASREGRRRRGARR